MGSRSQHLLKQCVEDTKSLTFMKISAWKQLTAKHIPNYNVILFFITQPLIFVRFYWLLYVTWCKLQNGYHAITPPGRHLSSDYFRQK